MQILLTENEYIRLVDKSEYDRVHYSLGRVLQELLEITEFPCGKTYCDECPIVDLADRIKETRHDFLLKDLCTKEKNFSK